MKKAVLAFALSTAGALALAQATPAGLWRTIDDDGKTEKSLVRIEESAGVFSGRIEKIADPAKADAKCGLCGGALKDRPMLGMTVIDGVRPSAREPGLYDGGEILDPSKGKSYKVRLKPVDGGKKLEVRGYVGAPMFGRTQTWVRAE
ncbi:MAG: DUF2147 domain-containing protein [Burkholderiaceae bacterium]